MMRMPRCVAVLAVALNMLALMACDWPPPVDSRRNIERLPVTQERVRVRGLDDGDIAALARLRALKELDFTGGWGVMQARLSDKGLDVLATLDLPHLTILSLGFCSKVTDAGMVSVARLPHLRVLGLLGTRGITDEGLRAILRQPTLDTLDLRGCNAITDRGLDLLRADRAWKLIMLGGCEQITPAGLERLRQRLPNATVDKDDKAWIELKGQPR